MARILRTGRIAPALLTLLLVLPRPGLAEGLAGAAGLVFTADERGNSVSRVDLASGAVETVALPISPHNVQVGADGRRLLAVGAAAAQLGSTHGHGDGGQLLILDPHELDAPPASIAVGDHPAHVVTDRDGGRAFVTNAGDDTVSVVDLAAGAVVASIPTGDYPHGLRLSPDGASLLVANVQDGTVSLIDVASLAELARIPVGTTPVQVAFLPDGRRAYVSLRDEDAVAIVDLASRTTTGRIAVGDGPIQLFATPDGAQVLVANQGSEALPGDTVSVIDVASGKVRATVTTDAGAHGVAISADGALAFVTNVTAGTLSVVEVAAPAVVATYSVGAGPNGVSYLAP
ncbi:YncE family protein [Tabrizicola oligotrophica]|uniref:YncE family protein n=1 Tax=Tabrizicola oligotrophica TaxID=2710650 RepID=A0A6M0QVU8_9RHOB|nr:beta-propeller fold lactonase family protein [Tabrizicola oligotrophica]NEY91550.1 YncE family protein [Tabrizicola oligotrophica]